jgi:hypothetical protein
MFLTHPLSILPGPYQVAPWTKITVKKRPPFDETTRPARHYRIPLARLAKGAS